MLQFWVCPLAVIKKRAKFAYRMKRITKTVLLLYMCFFLTFFLACRKEQRSSVLNNTVDSEIDLTEIEDAGELICVTLNGPDTYYEFRGRGAGLQYMLAESFANSIGLRMRMEVARDTNEMITMLKASKVDVIACKIPVSVIRRNRLCACGVNDSVGSWAVKTVSTELQDALNEWYSDGIDKKMQAEVRAISSNKYIRRRSYSPFSSKTKGVVSNYDMLFLRAGRICGWDWKLIASQCYQESGFDAEAVSWAGARGLMQLMPSTANAMGVGVDELFDPEKNVIAAAKFIRQLERKLGEVADPLERKKFVLASYNGGFGHISDAMNLARKHGRNPHSWSDVSYFVLHLSEPRFYKDPAVKCGYMIGRETYDYVNAVMYRWNGYHAVLHNAMPKGGMAGGSENNERKRNRFSTAHQIVGRDDSLFSIVK